MVRQSIAAAALLMSCVPKVSLDETPCPCGPGYECCATLAVCLPTGGECPDNSPTSSAKPCEADNDCPVGEGCYSWKLSTSDQTITGPQQCRRRCGGELPCDETELCQLSPHDGKALSALAMTPLCLPTKRPAGCEQWTCDESCAAENIARTFCAEGQVRGCLVASHPLCGLTCKPTSFQRCFDKCKETTIGAICDDQVDITPCLQFACGEACPDDKATWCESDTLKTCMRVRSPEPACEHLCQVIETPCAKGCKPPSETPAHCAD